MHSCVEQVVEEERTVLGAVGGWNVGLQPAPMLGLLAGHNCPANGLGVFEDSGLDGLVFSGCGHRLDGGSARFEVLGNGLNGL
jgi:hypothetical protein